MHRRKEIKMSIFWLNLSFVYILSFFSRYFTSPTPNGNEIIRPNKFLVFIAFLILVSVSGLRENIGDTEAYMHSYELNDFTWEQIKTQKDIGFGVLQMFLQKFSDNPQLMIFSTALLTNLLIILVLYNYSRLLDISIFVYITGGLFLVSMNGIRQVLAAAIFFTATKFLIEGKWKRYMLIVLFASTFHQSALILIPIYFLARTKAWSKFTIILIFISILIVIGFEQFTTVLFSAIEDTQYGMYQNFDEGGANYLRVVVYSAPLLIAFLGRDKMRSIFRDSDYIVNMSILGLVFMIVSTQNWIFARFSIYFNLYHLILISWVVKLFGERDQKIIYYVILVCYFLYYYYENVLSLNILYKSNFF
jgi:transmembrane protein EpsG